METVDLICEKRETRPKGLVHRIRHEGRVPGIIYGNQHAATAVAVPAADLRSRVATAARQRLIRIKSSSSELDGRHVILKEIQRAPVSGNILHADFYEVDLSKPLRVAVALKFTARNSRVGGSRRDATRHSRRNPCFRADLRGQYQADL